MEVENYNEVDVLEQSKRDPRAFELIYKRYFDAIFSFIMKRLRDKESAFDLTQQVFFNALTNLKNYKHKGLPFSSYLFKIAINECNQYFRVQSKTRFSSINEESMEEFSEEIFPDSRSEKVLEKLQQAIQALKHEELFLIELRYFEQRSYQEIAQILGLTVTNCKVKVHRVIKKLKKKFRYEE